MLRHYGRSLARCAYGLGTRNVDGSAPERTARPGALRLGAACRVCLNTEPRPCPGDDYQTDNGLRHEVE